MAMDETGTLARLSQLRLRCLSQDHRVPRTHCRLGRRRLLVEFASPVEAVKCALKLQEELEDRNAGLPEERRLAFRVGGTWGT
jgi:adenylate cyclase